MRVLLAFAVTAALAAGAPQFDVAAVKPHAPGIPCGDSNVLPGGRLVLNCFTLREIVSEALDVLPQDLAGGPDWVRTERWDVIAKAEGVSGEMQPREYRTRLRALVEEVFQIKLRVESKQVSGFLLVRAHNGRLGPGLTANKGSPYRFDVRPGISLTAQQISMADFAEWLKSPIGIGKPVQDRTGLPGPYDLTLKWAPFRADGSGDGPSIFTALREQLGLKLRAAKVQTDIFAIEQAQRPAAE
jgi:uncharacterized protein (TIGR03435 family)